MGLAAVESAAFEYRAGLDQQDRLVGAVQEVRSELVGETPPTDIRIRLTRSGAHAESESLGGSPEAAAA
jgi:hypothetical protein